MANKTLATIATTSTAASLLAGDRFYMVRSGVDFMTPGSVMLAAMAAAAVTKEPGLGNPSTNGYVLSSTAAGVRSWVAQSVGGGSSAWGDITGKPESLVSISGLTTAANKLIYTTALDVYAVADLSPAGRALIDDPDASAQRATLGLGTMATQAAATVAITGGTLNGVSLENSDIGTGTPGAGVFTDLTGSAFLIEPAAANIVAAEINLAPITDTVSRPLFVNQVWNNPLLTATGVEVNITNTASTVDSLVQNWKVDGGSVAKIDRVGNLTAIFTGAIGGITPAPGAFTTLSATGISGLGTGTADGTTYLRGDGAWAVPAGGGGGGAPTDATYIVQTANGSLSAEQALSALATGIVKNTTTTGVLSIATAGTDYLAPAAIGVSVQAYDADLTTWAGVIPGAGVAAALAVDVNESGSVLINDSDLGTPTSGNLGNCTNLPAAQLAGNIAASRITIALTTAQPVAATTLHATISLTLGTSGILVGGTNVIQQRNGALGQTLQVFDGYTDDANNGRFAVGGLGTVDGAANRSGLLFEVNGVNPGSASGNVDIGTRANASVAFVTNGQFRFYLTGGGHLLAYTDNAYDIGASGASSPRSIYFGTSLFRGATKVLGAQGAAVAHVAGGAVSQTAAGATDCMDAINNILARLEAHGIIAT